MPQRDSHSMSGRLRAEFHPGRVDLRLDGLLGDAAGAGNIGTVQSVREPAQIRYLNGGQRVRVAVRPAPVCQVVRILGRHTGTMPRGNVWGKGRVA